MTAEKSAMVFVIPVVPFLVLQNPKLFFFNHAFQLPLQLNQVSCRYHYWGRPTCFSRNCLLMWHGLGTGGVGVHFCCSEVDEGSLCDHLLGGGVFKSANVLACTDGFSEVEVSSSVLHHLRLRTSSNPSSWVICSPVAFGDVVWPSRVLALSTAFDLLSINCICAMQGTKESLSSESFAVDSSVVIPSIDC